MDAIKYKNVAVKREVVERFQRLYPQVALTTAVRLWMEAEIRRGEKDLERAARNDAYWPEAAPARAHTPDPAAIFATD